MTVDVDFEARLINVAQRVDAMRQGKFDDFPVIRIDEAPLVTNVYSVPPGPNTPPSGVGEPGVPPFAPALTNAIFAATGKRIRALPIGKQLET
jgi:isoquinoline 1-oxidoreductase subunit beta